MHTISDLPNEILVKIFKFYLETEMWETLIKNVSSVCERWKNLCYDISVWKKYHIDGSMDLLNMISLIKNGLFCNADEVCINGKSFDNVGKANEVERLHGFILNRKIIKNVDAFKLIKEIFSTMADRCTKLKVIEITNLKTNLSYLLYPLMITRGSGIVKIDLSDCDITNLGVFIRRVSDCCPNLKYLYLMKISCIKRAFPTKYIQMHCRKIKGLRLDQNIEIMNNKHSPGFPDLEDFTYLNYRGYYHSDQLNSILFNSPKLKNLELFNILLSVSFFLSLPASSVERLFISRGRFRASNDLCDVLNKWSHSLKEVDLSYCDSAVNAAVQFLVSMPVNSPLELLNLNFTAVLDSVVKEVLKKCRHLHTIKLEECTNLGYEMKKTYSGKMELEELSAKLKRA